MVYVTVSVFVSQAGFNADLSPEKVLAGMGSRSQEVVCVRACVCCVCLCVCACVCVSGRDPRKSNRDGTQHCQHQNDSDHNDDVHFYSA